MIEKAIAFVAMVFGVKGLPDAATTLIRMFGQDRQRRRCPFLHPVDLSLPAHPLEHHSRRLAYLRLKCAPPLWGTGRSEERIQQTLLAFLNRGKYIADPAMWPPGTTSLPSSLIPMTASRFLALLLTAGFMESSSSRRLKRNSSPIS